MIKGMEDAVIYQYTKKEESLNALTHGLGVLFSLVATGLLMGKAFYRPGTLHILSYLIYGASLFLLYSASTCYHLAECPRLKKTFKKLDHICIYLLIAGSYTPFLLINLKEDLGHSVMYLVWGLALIGVLFKVFAKKRYLYISVLTYLGLSWISVLLKGPFLDHVPYEGVKWVVIGGSLYTFGVLFYLMKKLPYHHAIWHLFVLGGSVSHFLAVFHSA